jgi:hypothetical protein
MSSKIIFRLIELGVSLIIAISLFIAWRSERADRTKLATELAAAQQTLTQATDRQRSRDADLLRTLATLAAQKREVQSPEQILKALPQQIPLPQPITQQPAPLASLPALRSNTDSRQSANSANPPIDAVTKPTAPEPQAVIPAADMKPLYDFALDCKACQAKLAAAQSDLTDEKSKTATLTKERDESIRTANGGSPLQRFARAARWLLIGAAAGAVAARSTR